MNPQRDQSDSQGQYIRKGARRTGNIVVMIFLSIICLVALSFCVFLLLRIEIMQGDEEKLKEDVERLSQIEEEAYLTEDEALALVENEKAKTERETTAKILNWIKEQILEGSTTTWMLRNLYSTFSDELVVGSNGTFYFLERNPELKQALVLSDELAPGQDGRMRYLGADPSVSATFGIDVSKFQGDIDWEKVAADGVKFAFIRVGSRGSTEGKFIEDTQFEDNIKGALENGIDVGVYFYTQAINEEEAIEEADFVISAIEPYEIKLPVVYDIESADSDEARTNELTMEHNTQNARAFCDRVSAAGYQPMIYGNLKSFLLMLDLTQLEDIKKWFAFYDKTQYYPYEYSYWQYSDKGKVDGIEGDVDINICIEDLSR